jgi:hypothetical protein
MALSLAYQNFAQSGINPAVTRQNMAKSRFMCKAASMFKVGSRVRVHDLPATVLGYNIADFGRWLGISHPVVIELDSGEVFCCKLSEISEYASKSDKSSQH